MNFFLPSFLEYLQSQPSLAIVQQHLEYADVETASISTMVLTIILLLSTVEGVILFFTTLYSWCFLCPLPLLDMGGEEYHNDENENENGGHYYSRQRQRRQRRRRRRRRLGSHGGEHHLFWWLDVEYETEDSEGDDEEDFDDDDDENWSDRNDNEVDGQLLTLGRSKEEERCRMTRRDRIELSLQEHNFHDTQSEDVCCAICLVDFRPNDRVVSGTQPCCKSCFHRNCLEEWLKIQNSCPCCRTNLLLKRKDLLLLRKRTQKATTEPTNDMGTTASWVSGSSVNEPHQTNNEQRSTPIDVEGSSDLTQQVIGSGVSSNDTIQWSPENVPELSPSGSWDQFWFLVF